MIETVIDDKIPAGTVLFIGLPPRGLRFSSFEQLQQWYADHPGSLAMLTNVGVAA